MINAAPNAEALIDEYIAAGWSLVPVPPGTKGPRAKGWNTRGAAIKSSTDLPMCFPPYGVGLLHAFSGTMALDIDDWNLTRTQLDVDALYAAPDAVTIQSGKEGRGKLLYRMPFGLVLPTKKFYIETGKDERGQTMRVLMFELRCGTLEDDKSVQDVLPPSIHPETMQPYRWGGAGHLSRLPMLPLVVLELWQAALVDTRPKTVDCGDNRPVALDAVVTSWDEIRDALNHIDPDCSRDDWVTCGMALHWAGEQRFDDEEGFDLWDKWSQRGEKYPGEPIMGQQWRSFRSSKAAVVTLGSMFHLARQAGWVRPVLDASTLFGAVASISDREDWPDPIPLPGLPPVPPFDLALLPDAVRPWVADIADRLQIPPDVPAIGAVTALSSALGRRVQIRPKQNDLWTVVPNLWGMVVAPPGYKKSPALNEVMRPLHILEARANEEHLQALSEWELDKEQVALRNSAAKSAARGKLTKDATAEIPELLSEPEEPVPKRFVVNNFTLEALGEVMIGNESGVLAFGDELNGLLRMTEKPGNEELQAFLLSAWNGEGSVTFDRIGRGRRFVPNVCISILGGIQPGRLVDYLTNGGKSGGAIDSGFLNRFQLLTWPELDKAWKLVDRIPDLAARETYHRVFERVAGGTSFPNLTDAGTASRAPEVRRFDAGAQAAYYEWMERNERLIREEGLPPVMASHLSKFSSLVASLALIFAVADDARGDIPVSYVRQAIGWADYLRDHAERVFACTTRPESTSARALLWKIRDGALTNPFSAREVYRNEWSMLSDRSAVEKATDLLCEYDYLRRVEVPSTSKGGRPSVAFTINPKALTCEVPV